MHGSKNEESEETFLIYHLIVSIPVNKKSVLIIIFFLQMKITGKKIIAIYFPMDIFEQIQSSMG